MAKRRGGRAARLATVLAMALAVACGTPFGIYHEVGPGQTLYGISRTYNVDLDKLTRLNRIQDPTKIRPGDLVFVPGADRQRQVATSGAATSGGGSSSSKGASRSGAARSTDERTRIDSASKSGGDKKRSTWAGGDAPKLIWPVEGNLTSGFGKRDDVNHDGVDIQAPEGTPVIAAADGRVIYSGDGLSGYGNLVIVRHTGNWSTIYAHNDENLVAKGDFVSQGQKIATVGDTGRASAHHLHFEVRFGKAPKNPLDYLP